MDYFVVNKQMDYDRGFLFHAVYKNNGLVLTSETDYGAFFSRIFDSRKEETQWHRFTTEWQNPANTAVSYTFYACDRLDMTIDEHKWILPELLKDSHLSIEEKKELLKPLEKKRILKAEDFLLHEVKGRYLFFLAELYRQGGESPEIGPMVLYFPKEDWLKFLPGIYSKKEAGVDFTSRFLGVFQSLYDDCNQRIQNSSQLLEPLDLDYEGLKKLAGWFHFKDLYIWPEEKLRALLCQAPKLIEETGTVQGMIDFIQLYTGEKPLLIECQNTAGRFQPETFEKPYGENPYEFVLLVKEKYISTSRDYQALMCLIRQMKPVYMKVKLIPLRPRLTLGSYSYVGINSKIGTYTPLRLDGRSSLIFSAVGAECKTGGTGT